MILLANSKMSVILKFYPEGSKRTIGNSPTISADGQKATLSIAVIVSTVDVPCF
jgi:hypothetical protein